MKTLKTEVLWGRIVILSFALVVAAWLGAVAGYNAAPNAPTNVLPYQCKEALELATRVVFVASEGLMIAQDIPETLGDVLPDWDSSVTEFMAAYPLCVQN